MYDSAMVSTLDNDEYDVEITSSRYSKMIIILVRKNTYKDVSSFTFSDDYFIKKVDEFFNIKESIKEDKFNRYRNSIFTQTEITLQEALEGIKKKITFFRWVKCQSCDGSGVENKNKNLQVCQLCVGRGEFQNNFGRLVHCIQCDGTGEIIEDVCK